ncbi:hypothetical protein OEG84_04000 [Hoeflea sp. G2-23]|uniref:Acb2/Tad1 hairpin domain-containing protein n=1 Tax=Hoeflea algicola TaxID=2983763 RepID=A0ABT3Z562_9HYPH|nr:hypothetical protein [Hoeflea algicola]MCY0146900.1 hypothetical protein [Hoeflea algicola]
MSLDDTDRVGMAYRSLSMHESAQVHEVKERGQEFIDLLNTLGQSVEVVRAKARIEEAVMWSVKHITAA